MSHLELFDLEINGPSLVRKTMLTDLLHKGRYKMKTLLIILVIVLSAGMAWGFSWEGELDPNELDNWQITAPTMVDPLRMIATAQNPDKEAEIQRIQMVLYIDGTLISYRYFKEGEIYDYVLNVDTDTYERQDYTETDRQSCMQCHNVKLVSKVSI